MSRHGYSDDCDDYWDLIKYRGQVASTIRGKRGQAFLRELLASLDAMPEKELVYRDFIDEDGRCCTLGVVMKTRGLEEEAKQLDPECNSSHDVADLLGISWQLAAEIMFENDEWRDVTDEKRWELMRRWVAEHIVVRPEELLPTCTAFEEES